MRAEYTSRSRYKTNAFIAILLLLRGHIIALLFRGGVLFPSRSFSLASLFVVVVVAVVVLIISFLQQRFNQRLLVLRGGTVSVHDVAFGR